MGVREIDRSLEQWQMGVKDLRRRVILAPTPRERERWYAILLLAQGLTAAATAEALERDPHTIGRWASAFGEGGPAALIFEQPEVRGEGQLLFGGVPGDGRGGMDGTGGQQQQRDLGCLPDATEGKASRAAAGHLGQCAGPSWGGGAELPVDGGPRRIALGLIGVDGSLQGSLVGIYAPGDRPGSTR